MSVTAAPSASFEAVAAGFATGLTGTIGVRLIDNAGATTTARSTASITEYPAGSGIYAKTMTAPATAGQYTIVWDNGATTPGNVATEDLIVTSSTTYTAPTGTAYISAADFKTTQGITVTTYDTDIATCVEAGSRAVDHFCRRRFWLDADATQIRYYNPTGRICAIDDLTTLTNLKTDSGGDGSFATTLTLNTDFTLEPLNAAVENPVQPYTLARLVSSGTYWPAAPRSVKVTGRFGWPAVPAPVVRATTILANILLKRQEAPFGIVTAGVDQETAMRIAQTDPTIRGLLSPLVRLDS